MGDDRDLGDPIGNRWVLSVVHGGRAALVLLVVGVPRAVTRAELLDRLEGWRGWSRLAPGPGGRVTCRKAGVGSWAVAPNVVGWEALSPAEVRYTLAMPGELHSMASRAARRSGLTLGGWLLDRAWVAAQAELEGAARELEAGARVVTAAVIPKGTRDV